MPRSGYAVPQRKFLWEEYLGNKLNKSLLNFVWGVWLWGGGFKGWVRGWVGSVWVVERFFFGLCLVVFFFLFSLNWRQFFLDGEKVSGKSTYQIARTKTTRPDFHSTITRLRFQLLVLVLGQSSFLRPLVFLSIIAESSGWFAFCLDCMERSRRLVLLCYQAPSRSVPV